MGYWGESVNLGIRFERVACWSGVWDWGSSHRRGIRWQVKQWKSDEEVVGRC